MSSGTAVTENVVFIVRVASFYPIDYSKLNIEFGEWIKTKEYDYRMMVYRTAIESKEKNA